ncbi:Inositol-pentakisphosphate 2-kinase [Penicillium cataractarum]|uniref:Inositol-pentakisphosphate 2-kinase n=1 Tax=Penicillium cataractarum TaxID=2100454 RepID=A0A9W9V354_9EURO|nr:Inositol-pentakisphosphate 2-kinase [Penicillium cataractarum]KAJ5364496.1 Inositol-pentakisphosphate 2-kinase [Penicillium cataractarum]
MTKPSLLELPPGVQLVYLAEGGANVVYRFVSAVKSPLAAKRDPRKLLSPVAFEAAERFTGKLLRLRKDTAANVPYKEIVQNFNTIVRPLFKADELVDQTLIRLPDGLIHRCNEQLRLAEVSGGRPKKRHGGYLSLTEPFGLLVTDMTTFDEPGSTLAELKPKWLVQSPSAPTTAHRCRTCALREMKNYDASLMGQKEQRSFCPLDLVSETFEDVLRATTFIKGCSDRTRLASILFNNPTLQKLLSHQSAYHKVGLHGPPPQSRETSLDMTLRDCTMYIKVCTYSDTLSKDIVATDVRQQIPKDEKLPVEIRLGDLDLKTGAGGKAEYWRDIEIQLIEGGWYDGLNSTQEASECVLHISPAIQRPTA